MDKLIDDMIKNCEELLGREVKEYNTLGEQEYLWKNENQRKKKCNQKTITP